MDQKLRKTVNSYNKHAKQYADYTSEMYSQYQLNQFLTFVKGKKVLDAGCGSGRDMKYLRDEGLKLEGIDISSEMVKEARKRTRGKITVMDMAKLDFKDESFNGVWCSEGMVHINKKKARKVLKEFFRVLKGNGILYLSLKEGRGEEMIESPIMNKAKVLNVYYTQFKIEELLEEAGFNIITNYAEHAAKPHNRIIVFAKKSQETIT